MINEEFKNIQYKGTNINVGNQGTIIWNGKERLHYLNKDGYYVCSIKTIDGWRSISIHRLVAIAFIPNPNNYQEINHKDFNRKNFNIENLEWCDRNYNVNYSIGNRRTYIGQNNPNYNNHILKDKYKKDKMLSLQKQSRPGLQNGRCRKIKLFNDGILEKEFDYIVACCEYLRKKYKINATVESIRSRIDNCCRTGKIYKKHFTFVKE